MKVLIAVERNVSVKMIADFISRHYWKVHSDFVVIKVLAPLQATVPLNFLPPPVLSDMDEERHKIAEALVEQVAGALIAELHTVNVETMVKDGFVAETILEVASQIDASLIVLGCGPRSHKSLFGMYGSVLADVCTRARCSVLVVRPGEETRLRKHSAAAASSLGVTG